MRGALLTGPCVVCRRTILYPSDDTTILCDDCADRVIQRLRCPVGCAAVPLGRACWCRPEQKEEEDPAMMTAPHSDGGSDGPAAPRVWVVEAADPDDPATAAWQPMVWSMLYASRAEAEDRAAFLRAGGARLMGWTVRYRAACYQRVPDDAAPETRGAGDAV